MNTDVKTDTPSSSILPMSIIGLLFFIFGFVTWLNGSLIPFLKVICDLTEFQAMFVAFAFYIAYTVMALPMSMVLKHTGYRTGMVLGLAIMVVGALAFIPAALNASYPIFLLALFILGTGLTILQTASNPYVVMLGPKESAAMRISILGILNKLAGVIVPIAFTALILSGLGDTSTEALEALTASELQNLSERLIMPYIYMAVVLAFLIALVWFAPLPHVEPEESENSPADGDNILSHPQAILGAIALFFYVGVEVIAGDSIGLYGQGLGVQNATSLTSYTMGFMVIGYIVGITCIPRYLSQQQALLGSTVIGTLCVFGIVFSNPESTGTSSVILGWLGAPDMPNTVFYVALLGLGNALVWPAIWPLALDGLGKLTPQGSALLIMGIAGGAILSVTFGWLSEILGGMQAAYWVCLPSYLFILFYALKGHKMRRWS